MKSDEEVDTLALYLLADSPEGLEGARSIDRTIAEIPGLEGLTLIEDVVDRAVERRRRNPLWAIPPRVPQRTSPAPPREPHWVHTAAAA